MSLLDEMSKYPIAMRQAEERGRGALSNAFFLLATFSDLSGWDTTWGELQTERCDRLATFMGTDVASAASSKKKRCS